MSKGAILGATTCKACARLGCQKTFPPRGRKRFCSSVCRKIADQESEAFQRRQYKRSVQQHERRIQHQRRRRVFTAAVAEDHEVVQGGVTGGTSTISRMYTRGDSTLRERKTIERKNTGGAMSSFNDANDYASYAVWGTSYFTSDNAPSRRPEGTPLQGTLVFKCPVTDPSHEDRYTITLTGKTASHDTWATLATDIDHLLRNDYHLQHELSTAVTGQPNPEPSPTDAELALADEAEELAAWEAEQGGQEPPSNLENLDCSDAEKAAMDLEDKEEFLEEVRQTSQPENSAPPDKEKQ